MEEQVPARLLSRITAYDLFTSVVAYPLGLALAGVLAAHVLGVGGMLWLGAATALSSMPGPAVMISGRSARAIHPASSSIAAGSGCAAPGTGRGTTSVGVPPVAGIVNNSALLTRSSGRR